MHLHFLKSQNSFFKLELILKIIIFLLLLTALSSPVIIEKFNPFNRNGKDIVLALDASGSMNASGFDFENEVSEGKRLSRFEISKLIAKEFINRRVNDNIGVVIYGDFAFIASPITYEKKVVSSMLTYLTQGMAGQNTAIGEAIAMSVRAFKFSKAKTKIVILLSDGEHNSGALSPKDALNFTKEKSIKIYTIAMGNSGEADEALLEKIAKESNGAFFRATNAKELKRVYEEIDRLESSKIKSREFLQKEYFFQVLLIFALVFLLLLLFKESKK